jgi:hypothetical protein
MAGQQTIRWRRVYVARIAVSVLRSRAMRRQWAWVLITMDGVTRFPGVGPQAALAAVGVDVDGDTLTGNRSYLLEIQFS